MKFHGKKVLVTGGSSGIGADIALRFAEKGADVVITYHENEDGADRILKKIEKMGGTAEKYKVDFSSATLIDVYEVIWKASASGPLDILVNNAGVMLRKSFLETEDTEYDRVMTANAKIPFFLMQVFARTLKREKREGSIINITSISTDLSLESLAVYEVSKAALVRMTKSAALALAKSSIRVNAVSPGLVATGLNKDLRARKPNEWLSRQNKIPLGQGSTQDISGMVLFLASKKASWITGQNFTVDGGQVGTIYDSGLAPAPEETPRAKL